MPKTEKNVLIDDPMRCKICGTVITLYPKSFAPCPHCQQRICRRCWGGAWLAKAFTAEACAHNAENDGRTLTAVGENNRTFDWDWQKGLFIAGLSVLAAGILMFLFNLFIF